MLPVTPLFYCPTCGSQKMHQVHHTLTCCPDCGLHFYTNPKSAVAAIIENSKNEVLFTVRKHDPCKGMYDLSGGFVDIGETAEQAVVREVKEELNIKVTHLTYIASFPNIYPYRGLINHTLDMGFACQVDDFSTLQAKDDVEQYLWLKPEQAKEKLFADSLKKLIDVYVGKKFSSKQDR